MACSRCYLRLISVNNVVKRTISMSAMRRAQEALDKMKEKNPYFDKYADKIARLQQSSREEFLERLDKVVNPIVDAKSQTR